MLVLSRKTGEALVIEAEGLATPIKVTLVAIKGHKVRLGVEADRSITVDRLEVYRKRLCEGGESHLREVLW
jgi:carbon storage regulator CsrA